ncbi:hypothetical protein ACAX60_004429 [Serratia marcescens]
MENNEKATEYTFPIESKEYFEHLLGKSLSDGEKFTKQDYDKIEEAYNKSHDIRKFEIELYWKRSTYFWTLISVLVAICGVVSAAFLKDGKFPTELRSFLFCTSILGYFISLHFLITCVSGKQWQENWERHIDILESYFSGNLYKLNLVKGKLRYSISLSNEIIVAAITFAWIIIIIYNMLDIPKAIMWKGVTFLIVITAAYLWMSLKRSKNTDIDITFNIRTVKSANIIGKSNRYLEQSSTKWVNRIITGVVIVLLLFSTLYYNSDTGKQMELGSLTDWISAGANICMALAAGYAAVNAKQWFSQRSHTKGFDKAENILSTIDNHYRDRLKYANEIHSALEYLNSLDLNNFIINIGILEKLKYFSNKHTENIELIDKLSDELLLIERWSITVVNIELINAVIKSLRSLNESAAITYKNSYSYLDNVYDRRNDKLEGVLKQIDSQYKDFVTDLATLEHSYDKFKKQKFTNFFRVS